MKKIIKYRNLFVFLALTLICTFSFSFTGCSGSKNDTIFGYMGNGSNAGPGESNSTADYNRQQQSYSSDAEYSMLSADGSTPSSQMVERKIIRDANITMEVEDIEKSYDNILAALAQYNGYEAGRDMNTDSGGSPRIGATLKIPADKLDTFMGDIQKEGKLISSSISSS
ncbi:MAG: DUF4349 domain-containing protein, partial [Oscillospiraceae bacterium]|nr:DUF4349 domain-containing protein [Oscillospiraceae bacterium]